MEEKQFLNMKEASEYLGIHRVTLTNLANQGKVQGARKLGGKWLFDKKALDDYVRWGSIR